MEREEDQQLKKKRSWKRELSEWVISLSVAVGVAMLFQTYVYAQSEVHNVSMQKTLVEGQRLIEDKWSYRFHAPEVGDIVIIDGPESDVRLIKRVIGLPGDTIDMRDGQVYVNDRLLEESYAFGQTYPGKLSMPLTIPENELFVMGDNREHSLDSRDLGTIALDSIEGKAVFRIWPLPSFGDLYQ